MINCLLFYSIAYRSDCILTSCWTRKYKYSFYKIFDNRDKTGIGFHTYIQISFFTLNTTLNTTLCVLAKIGCQDLCFKTITTENKVAVFKSPHWLWFIIQLS